MHARLAHRKGVSVHALRHKFCKSVTHAGGPLMVSVIGLFPHLFGWMFARGNLD